MVALLVMLAAPMTLEAAMMAAGTMTAAGMMAAARMMALMAANKSAASRNHLTPLRSPLLQERVSEARVMVCAALRADR